MAHHARFHVQGLDCADEVAVVRGQLEGQPGIEALDFDLFNARLTVTFDQRLTDRDAIGRLIGQTGLRATTWHDSGRDEGSSSGVSGRGLLAALSGLCLLAAVTCHATFAGGLRAAFEHGDPPPVALGLYVAAIVAGSWFVVPRALAAFRRMRPDMHLLMCVAVAGAVGLGDWLEAATVAFLFALSVWLEHSSVARTRRAIRSLLDLAPATARCVPQSGGLIQELAVELVRPGTTIVVRPGERIPLDGVVSQGRSHVDEAPLTGEPLPVGRGPGENVFAGTINGEGLLEIRTTRPAGATALARMVHLVQEAQSRRAVSQQWIERFALRYTPAMMLLALGLALVPPLLGGDWSEWFYRALVVLVIACPCALVISTPVSLVSALTAAARRGILVKGGAALEAAATLRVVAFDKTGTVTLGRPEVAEVVPLNGHSTRELLERAAALEIQSRHPLAQAVVRRARSEQIEPLPADGFHELQGRGAAGTIGGREFWIGSPRLQNDRLGADQALPALVNRFGQAQQTVVVVGNAEHVCGVIAVSDAVRPGAAEALQALRSSGIERIVLLTGDSPAAARVVASVVQADECRAGLLPEDKVRAVEELVDEFQSVAMVGDGVNDAPALARATLGIAMAAAGSDAAIEAADVALMSDDLSRLAWLVRHARRTLRTVKQNIAFSLAVKLLFLALAAAGMASLWLAIAADTGATLLVIANGMALLRGSNSAGS
ncbi:MAG: heavy metal translocating P-type ATPase [Planctomycetaceae bacterium]